MAVGDYGYHYLNGKEIASDPDQLQIVLPNSRENDLGITSYIYSYKERPILEVIGGDKSDQFTGDTADIKGGRGGDIFLSAGTGFDETYSRANILKGQGGADIFYDTYGSTDYYGGTQGDFFTNARLLTNADEGDADRAFMGRGADQAEITFGDTSGPDGQHWEDRSLHLDGGKGQDRLFLNTDQVGLQLTSDKVLDFREVNSGTMTIANSSFTDFESFTLNIGARSVTKMHGARLDDSLIWLDTGKNRDQDLTIYGHNGDDFIVGSYENEDDFIFGGRGDDIITGAGGQGRGWTDHLFGGAGNDMIFSSGIGVLGAGSIEATGGRGADLFVVSHGQALEYFTRIKDFKQGTDTIGLDFTGSYVLNSDDPRALVESLSDTNVVVEKDDAEALRFTVEHVTAYDTVETDEFSYLHNSGVLRFYNGSGWEKVAVIEGAPDLSLEDFAFFDWG
ncbi:hypothetical protein [Neptunicoccus cionae]|uniref:Calcium-binding protein n=1 Tax=Neptunicoccus cionae TaxID=2035344 RepID=A0A916QZI5_9RHOB|nr:hypothetical protein [Amylibacter cionae]GGA16557.1 hypothetical protein GCM10011498_16310 [Amylibacter cionae]